MQDEAYHSQDSQDAQLALLGLDDVAFLRAGFDAASDVDLVRLGEDVDLGEVESRLFAWIAESGERWAPDALRRETEAELSELDDESADELREPLLAGIAQRAILRPLAQELAAD